jgi:hypothetical protein
MHGKAALPALAGESRGDHADCMDAIHGSCNSQAMLPNEA